MEFNTFLFSSRKKRERKNKTVLKSIIHLSLSLFLCIVCMNICVYALSNMNFVLFYNKLKERERGIHEEEENIILIFFVAGE